MRGDEGMGSRSGDERLDVDLDRLQRRRDLRVLPVCAGVALLLLWGVLYVLVPREQEEAPKPLSTKFISGGEVNGKVMGTPPQVEDGITQTGKEVHRRGHDPRSTLGWGSIVGLVRQIFHQILPQGGAQ